MSENEAQVFRPELLPRRGELNAWLLAVAAGTGLVVLNLTWTIIPTWVWIFCGFLFFSATSISLGNWMDRRTRIELRPDGIHFENGLRRVRLHWPEIQKVAVVPARWGKSVQVIGPDSHFQFKTLGEVQYRGEVRGRTGFAQGQTILDTLLEKTGLTLARKEENAYYYARS